MKTARKNTSATPKTANRDDADIAKFQALAAEWWDIDGPMAPLHRMNPTRMRWLVEQLNSHFKSLKNIKILDIGCGGGLVSEPLARLGATVTGIDGAADLIDVATQHAREQDDGQGLNITYRHALTHDLISENKTFDAVIASEVIEHIPDRQAFLHDIARLLKPDGIALFTTVNRTPHSFALGIVVAEYIAGWLPAGTHDWKQFVKPSELYAMCREADLAPQTATGMVYHPLTKTFSLDERDLRINYFMAATKS